MFYERKRNMKQLSILGAALVVAMAFSLPAHAMGEKMPLENPATAHKISGTGTVVSANAAKGSIILKHEPIPALGWPKMTMQFKARNKTQLEKLKKGDQVEFQLEKSGQEYAISDIQAR
jgi:Cu/Ag efflux protein CusF